MNQALAVEGNYTATVYSVEPAGDNSSDIVITVATDSSETPANLTYQLIQPLEQTLEEVTDINEQISFAIMATERHGKYFSSSATFGLTVCIHSKVCKHFCHLIMPIYVLWS